MTERPECLLTVSLSLIKSKNLYFALSASYPVIATIPPQELVQWLLAQGEFVGDSCVYRSKSVQELALLIYFITPTHIMEYELDKG
jgi:hypothetical protein